MPATTEAVAGDGIEIREATTTAERRVVAAITHAATDSKQPLEYYQALRLATPRRATAGWWLLACGGVPAASLICYPLELGYRDRSIAGFGLGAVGTLPAFRRRGLASALCEHVGAHAARTGRTVGLLFSAIEPAIYERLGYRVAPAWDASCERLGELRDSGPVASLVPIDPRASLPEIEALYRAAHGGLCIRRDHAAWLRSLAANPSDAFVGIGDPLRGYARLYAESDELLEVAELVLVDGRDRLPVLRALAGITLGLGRWRMHGWFPLHDELRPWLHDAGRSKRLPMVRGHADLHDCQLWSTDYF